MTSLRDSSTSVRSATEHILLGGAALEALSGLLQNHEVQRLLGMERRVSFGN